MNSETAFSVIIPIYNKEKVLSRAIQSVLNQTYSNYEIVLVDDGSKDDSYSIASSFSKYSKVKLIRQGNKGVSVARNVGIENSKGKLITFLDPDDEWKPNHLEYLYGVYKKTNYINALYATSYDIKMLNGDCLDISKITTNKIIGNDEYQVINNIFSIYNNFQYAPFNTNTVMVPKCIFKDIGTFTVGCKRSQDIDMWFRILLKYPTVLINKSTTIYHREDSTATASITRNYNWPFFLTVDKLLESNGISASIKGDVIKFIDEIRISMARHLIMENKKKEAIMMLKKVKIKNKVRKKLNFTYILMAFPSNIIKKVYKYKNRNYLH